MPKKEDNAQAGSLKPKDETRDKLTLLLGANIAQQRKLLGMTQKELSQKLGITLDALAHIEKGRIAPKMSRLQDIADNLECTVSYLFRSKTDSIDENIENLADLLKDFSVEARNSAISIFVGTLGLIKKTQNIKKTTVKSSITLSKMVKKAIDTKK